jgi:hypothetical protein
MLKGKETVNLKDLKELQEDRMKKTVTKNKTLDVTNCGFKKLNNKLLSMKRKRDTGQSCYRNNPKKCKMGTSEDRIFEVSFDESQEMFFSMSMKFHIITVIVIMLYSDFICVLLLYTSLHTFEQQPIFSIVFILSCCESKNF